MSHKPSTQRTAGFRVHPVAAGCAALLMVTGAAQAQQASDTVVVTGIRASIENAIATKKNADGIVEAISAEDIGKLPDATVAESISRLPGVTAQRNKSTGRASSISVRGMSPDFNGALLNGREQASTGDSRGVEFDQFPAELLSSIVIHKTPEASLVGQGLSSTIDLRTVRPLDFNKRTLSVNVRKQRSGIDSGAGEGDGNRQSFSYVDQFADRTIGVALGFTKLKDSGAEQQKFNSWGGWAADIDKDLNPSLAGVKGIGGFTADTEQSSLDREGMMAVLQFKPNRNFESTLDLFKSKGSFGLKKTGLEGAIVGSAGVYDPNAVVSNAVVANGFVQDGTFSNYRGVVRNHIEAGEDKLDSFGWNNKLKVGDWTAVGDLARSKVKRLSSRYETTAGLAGNATTLDSMRYTGFNGSNFDSVKYTPGLNYADRSVVKLTDVNGWSGGPDSPQAGYVAIPQITDQVDNIRLSARRSLDMGQLTGVELGINLADRTKVRTTQEGRLMIKGGDPYGVATVPGSGVTMAGTTGIPVVSWDPRGSLGTIYELARKVDSDILNKDWSVKEKVTTSFIKGDLDGNLFGMPYRGNVGVQLVQTKQNSTGFNVDRAACVGNTPETCPGATVGAGKNYSDFNPSLNLNFDAGNDQVVRVGVAKVLARPNMGDMRASLGFSYDNTKQMYTGDGGNPELEPFRAKSFDVSYEKYFGRKGYVSVAGFYKDLDTYIVRSATPFDFKPFINPNLPFATQGMLTRPVNGNGGTIHGVELAVNVPFSMLAPALDGFGLMANISATNSNVSLPTSGFSTQEIGRDKIPLPGLSKNVTNLRAYYEKHGLQLSLAARKRSDFLGEISDFQDNRQLTFIKAETVVDLQLGYEFQTGQFKGLSVLFQGNNLTNSQFQRYSNTPDNIVEKVKYGKTYLLGLTYKY